MTDDHSGQTRVYPGHGATPDQVLKLANEYSRAAAILIERRTKKAPLSSAPIRFSALHAIELYLNAFLLKAGMTPSQLRGLLHDLAKRTDLALQHGLVLRNGTLKHLRELAETREYLATRYGADILSPGAEITRITATLDELNTKVSRAIDQTEPICAAPAASHQGQR